MNFDIDTMDLDEIKETIKKLIYASAFSFEEIVTLKTRVSILEMREK